MSESFTLTKAALVRLLDLTAFPNPDDPHSPVGPYTRGSFVGFPNPDDPHSPVGPYTRGWSWAMLNPQPLPPIAGPRPEPQPLEPQPNPWRSAFRARMVIDQAIAAFRAAEMTSYEDQTSRGLDGARMSIRELVDEYCGNVPPRWPRPWPAPLTLEMPEYGPIDLLAAGVQFQKAAELLTGNILYEEFSAAADQLLETGLSRLENTE